MKLIDKYNRVHNYLRISLTEKCNYNCIYCNPNKLITNSQKDELLTYEELLRLIEFFATNLGFKKFRFTGGEPLVRNGIFDFFSEVKKLKNSYNFTTGITTNGSLLNGKSQLLKESGVDFLNISLDSINDQKFTTITQKNELNKILEVIDESIKVGFTPLKINVVVIKGINDNEILEFVNKFKDKNVNLRFIEFMPFGSNDWAQNGFLSYNSIKAIIESKYPLTNINSEKNSVSTDFLINNKKATISFITSMSEHFCDTCNRVRINAKGDFRVCLFSEGEHSINFKKLFRENYSDKEILELLYSAIQTKWEKHPEPEKLAIIKANNMMAIGG